MFLLTIMSKELVQDLVQGVGGWGSEIADRWSLSILVNFIGGKSTWGFEGLANIVSTH